MDKFLFRRYLLFCISLFVNALGIAFIANYQRDIRTEHVHPLHHRRMDHHAQHPLRGARAIYDDTPRP